MLQEIRQVEQIYHMTIDDKVWVALIVTMPAIINAISQWKLHKVVKELEVNTNSIKDALISETKDKYRAIGNLEGIAREKRLQEKSKGETGERGERGEKGEKGDTGK